MARELCGLQHTLHFGFVRFGFPSVFFFVIFNDGALEDEGMASEGVLSRVCLDLSVESSACCNTSVCHICLLSRCFRLGVSWHGMQHSFNYLTLTLTPCMWMGLIRRDRVRESEM